MTLQNITTTEREGCAMDDERTVMRHHLEAAGLHGPKGPTLAVHAHDCTGVLPELTGRFRTAAAQLPRIETSAAAPERSRTQQRSLRRNAGQSVQGMMHTTIDRLAVDRDADLIEALRFREATAAERLVGAYGDRAYRLALRITGAREDAEEAVQDAFWSVIRKIDTFRGDAALGSWIYRITANAAYQRRRRRASQRDKMPRVEILPSFHEDGRHAEPIADWYTELDDPTVQTELRTVLTAALEELPDHYRAVIILHDLEGLSMAQIAADLNITVPTAKSRAHRARLLLRQRLGGFASASFGVAMASQGR